MAGSLLRWFKGPAAVAPVFLETPTRIRALGLVLVLAPMMRNFVQCRLRAAMKKEARPVAHPLRRRRLVDNRTTEMAMVWFDRVTSMSLRTDSGEWKRRPTKLADAALEILALLRIDPRVFTIPLWRCKMWASTGGRLESPSGRRRLQLSSTMSRRSYTLGGSIRHNRIPSMLSDWTSLKPASLIKGPKFSCA